MEYIEGGYIQKRESTVVLFDRIGGILEGEDQYSRTHYAKTIDHSVSKNISYNILTHNGVPLDPMGAYGRRERMLDTQMKKVSKGTFDFYLTYLKTNNSIYLTKARRGLLND